MTKIDLLLKIGGSILTDKQQSGIVNKDLINDICQVLKKLYDRNMKIALVTGVGSIGHQAVAKYSIHKGDDGSFTRRLGLSDAQIQVNELRNTFLKALHSVGIPGIQFYTSNIASASKMRPVEFNLSSIEKFLKLGMVPVVSGDVVADDSMGFSVMSGDIAFLEIFKQWGVKTLVFGTDVKGIYSADPKVNQNAQLIQVLDTKMMKNTIQGLTEGTSVDVSGAMLGKYRSILALLEVDSTAKIHIIDLGDPKNIEKIMDNEPCEHTVVQY
ncbi:MAG: isopentenyl phosphate kinase [Candidatus Kariarchaeaceae archaeon]|jgi:isopentenyl phosphate kinase